MKSILGRFLFAFLLAVIVGFFTTNGAFAEGEDLTLSDEELKILQNEVNLTQQEIESMPNEVLKELIKNDAKKIASHTQTYNVSDPYNNSPFQPLSIVKGRDIELGALAFTVRSDRAGLKKIQLYGNFEWLTAPPNRFTDAISLGWVTSAELTPSTNSSGDINQFQGKYQYSAGPYSAGGWITSLYRTTPHEGGYNGVGFRFPLKSGIGFPDHQGYINQYVYTKKSSGYFNLLFRYSHFRLSFSPSFSVYPSLGLAVTPTMRSTDLDFFTPISW